MSKDEMRKEENQAIEYWKRDIEFYHYNTQLATEYYAQIILNLIEKQQKELDQEKEKNKNLIKQLQDLSKQLREKEQENIKMRSNFILSLNDFILKDKIRAFIKKETFEGRYSFDLISAKRLKKLLEED